VVVESFRTINSSRTLVGLENNQEVFDKLLSLRHQVILVQVDAHVILSFKHLKAHDVGSLLLIQVLSEDIGALSMGLTPLLCLSIKQL